MMAFRTGSWGAGRSYLPPPVYAAVQELDEPTDEQLRALFDSMDLDGAPNIMNSVLKVMNSALKVMNSALKIMNSALKIMNSALKITNSVLKMMDSVSKVMNSALKIMNSV